MYDRIMVATDGSESSTAAVDHAVAIAAQSGATVHFVHVVDVGTEMSASGVGTIADELTTTLEQEAKRVLDDATARADEASVDYDRTALEGTPHESIVEYGAEHDVDLVVVGASGESGLASHLLGSTTDRVVRSSDTSVLVVRP